MGVDLTLLPLIGKDFWAARDVLRLERRRELWDKIGALPQQPIPKPLSCYVAQLPNGESGYGKRTDSPYGDPLTYTTAGAFAALADDEAVTDNWLNKAVWSYLAKMPPDWPIVLYWH